MTAVPSPSPRPLAVLPSVRRRVHLRPDTVAERVCARWGVTFEALAGWSRTSQIAAARRDLVRQLRTYTAMSLTEIGAYLGGRCHTTILSLTKGAR